MTAKSVNTQSRILDKSLDLFSENGYAETSLRDIASAVGINVSSIYNHFPSKESILDILFEEYVAYTRATVPKLADVKHKFEQAKPEDVTAEYLYDTFFFTYPSEHSERYQKILKIIHYEAISNTQMRMFLQYETAESTVVGLRSALNILVERELIPPLDSSKVASLIYSIESAYMKLSCMDLNHMDRLGGNKSMADLLLYVLQLIVDGRI